MGTIQQLGFSASMMLGAQSLVLHIAARYVGPRTTCDRPVFVPVLCVLFKYYLGFRWCPGDPKSSMSCVCNKHNLPRCVCDTNKNAREAFFCHTASQSKSLTWILTVAKQCHEVHGDDTSPHRQNRFISPFPFCLQKNNNTNTLAAVSKFMIFPSRFVTCAFSRFFPCSLQQNLDARQSPLNGLSRDLVQRYGENELVICLWKQRWRW